MAEYKPQPVAQQKDYLSRLKSWWDREGGWPLVIATALAVGMGYPLYMRYSQGHQMKVESQWQPMERELDKNPAGQYEIYRRLDDALGGMNDALNETESVTRELEDVLQESRETLIEWRRLTDELSSARVRGK